MPLEHQDMEAAFATLRGPRKPLPAGACDAHAHIFGPFDVFPLFEGRVYTPPAAPLADYLRMLDTVGFSRGVVVQASASGYDNQALLDALDRGDGRLKGIAVVSPDVSDAELKDMDRRGVCGVRFTDANAIPGKPSIPQSLDLGEFAALAPRLRDLGWHAQIFGRAAKLEGLLPAMIDSGLTIVLDHMGMPDTGKPVGEGGSAALLDAAARPNVWFKMTALRNTQDHETFAEVRPFHDAIVARAPDRIVWGTDWPFLGLGDRLPNVGGLIDGIDAWLDDATREALFVTNPARLYGF